MKKLLTRPIKRLGVIAIMLSCLLLENLTVSAQCYEDFYVYQVSPYGQLCSPQYATIRAEYYYSGSYVSGEFRWYTSDTDPNPVQTNYIYSDFGEGLTAEYSLYANNGTTVWVSFYNYNTGCESYRTPYTFYISPTPYLSQQYASKCGYDAAKVQLSSNVAGGAFQLYKLYEYYDPYYGNIQEYQLVQSNSTGYFEIDDFDPATDEYKYYAKVYHPYSCSTPYYNQLWFDITSTAPPTITGNLSVIAGSGTSLTASGGNSNFKWYSSGGTLMYEGSQFTTSTTLAPGTYVYQVNAVSWDGSCVSDPALVTVTVSLPNITYTPLFTNSNFTKTIDLSKPVGTLAGAAGTTPSGGVTYSIPIYTPPGTNGIEPSVSIGYNSQAASGAAGWGWNISGLSAISRTGKNIFHNGIVKPVNYTSDDAFLLDGMRLNVISGSNGANGTTYAGEAESFATITSFTTGSANNPGWFKVFAKDGSVMEFGNTLDSRVLTDNGANVMLWRLNKILDVNGNYIEFVYDNNLRDSRIKSINYTGNLNAGLTPYNSINFEYKLRTDKNRGYDAGASLSSSHLLDKIVVKAGALVTKSYQFNYGFDNINSFLKEVVEVAGDDVTALNSTIFLYGLQPQNLVTTATVALTGPYDFFSGDYDADGKTDLMAVKSYYDGNAKARLHHEYTLINGVSESGYGLLYTKTLPQNISSEILTDKKSFNFLNADYNGDGRDDVLQIISNTEQLNCFVNYRRIINSIVINKTKSFNSQTSYTDYVAQTIPYPTDGWGYSYQVVSGKGSFFIPGDFDGDGIQDYILFLAKKRLISTCGTNRLPYYDFDFKGIITSPGTNEVNQEIMNFGFGVNPHGTEFYAGTFANADAINVLDFDGDGKMEILVTKDGTSYVLSIQRISATTGYTFAATVVYTTTDIVKDNSIFPGDFNGDRKTDLLVRSTSGIWKILYSTGNAFASVPFTFNQTVAFSGNYGDDLLQVADFNGDGKSDILHGFPVWVNGSSSSSKFSVYYSKGALSAAPFYYEQYTYNNILASGKNGSSEGIVLGDFDGDGRIDLLNRYNVNAPADFISLKPPYGKERLLAKVTDGHNTTTIFEYKLLTDKSTYPYFYDRTVSLDDPANQNPYNYVQLPLYAVSSVIVPDGIGGNNTTSYSYENAVVHRAAKGFLGFKKIISKNDKADVTSITENDINTEFAVPYAVKQTTKLTSTGTMLSESQITNSFVNRSTGYADKRYMQKIDKILNIDHLNGTASETVNTFDLVGNITQTVSKVGILSGTTVNAIETSTTTTNYSIQNTPVAARPDNVTVTNTRTTMPSVSSTTAFTYNAIGLPVTQTSFQGLPKAVTSSYTYDVYGNPLTIITGSTDLSNRTSTNTYDAKGRFLLSKQLSSGGITQTETFEYANEKWGKPTKIVSNDCLTTSFEYDLFGRLKTTTLPQGFSVNNSIHWDVSGNNVSYAFTDYPGGNPDIKTWYDKLGRATKIQTAGFNNQWLTRLTTYNAKGQVATQTNDYYASETALVSTNTYDAYGRMLSAANTLNTVNNDYTALSNGEAQVVTTSSIGQTSTKISDATGKIIKAIDNGGQLNFTYDSRGNQTEVKHGNNILVTSIYDSYGRQTSLTDKNAGTITYSYDAFGQLVQQTDAKNNTYTMLYDGLGRITNRTGAEGSTIYEYSTTACNNNGLTKITGFNGVIKEYTYDAYKRPATEKLTVDGIPYTTSFSYNQYNALTKTIYPSGIEENRSYDANGDMLTVTGGNPGSPVTLFTAGNVNGFGQYTGFTLGNGKTTQNTFNYGIPSRYYTPGVQDFNLSFDYTKGNLTNRNDAIKGISESFAFDNLNRLTSATVNGVQQFAMSYDGTTSSSMGNIVSKTDAGNYVYRTDKINAVAYITNPAGAQLPPSTISTIEQQVSYTPFLKTAAVTEAPYSLDFTYGPDYQRVKTLLKNNTALVETRLYIGNYEKQIIAGGATREVHYVSGGNGLCAILVKEASIVTPYYVYTDHLGSLLTITNSAGIIVGEQNFDAWGRKRNPVNWQYASVPAVPAWLYRGYTSHEHLPNFTLINMNGRMYDPIQGRMLSPDNYVSTPFGTQGYNRYSYANNNPLSYVDPDGNHPLIIVGILVGGFLKGMQYDMSGKGTFLGGFWRGALVSGAGSALGVGLSGSFSSLGMVGGGIVKGGITGLASGGLGAALDGGNVFKGAFKGAYIGGLIGGVLGSIERLSIRNHDFAKTGNQTGDVFETETELDQFVNDNVGDVTQIQKDYNTNISLATEDNLPKGYSIMPDGSMYNKDGTAVSGTTSTKGGWVTRHNSLIRIAPDAKGGYVAAGNYSQMVINHEIMHAWHWTQGAWSYWNTEHAASTYSYAYAKAYGWASGSLNHFRSSMGYYPDRYSWRHLLGKGLNLGIR